MDDSGGGACMLTADQRQVQRGWEGPSLGCAELDRPLEKGDAAAAEAAWDAADALANLSFYPPMESAADGVINIILGAQNERFGAFLCHRKRQRLCRTPTVKASVPAPARS